MDTRKIANGLGWFSVALGLTELIAARPLARALGMKSTGLLRFFGVRELVSGIGLLTQDRKGPWVWARVAGDALDIATLGSAALSPRNPKRSNAAIAIAGVAPIVALDIASGARLGMRH
jgi:hypothetical protein